MKISEVISKLRVIASQSGDVDVVILSQHQLGSNCAYFSAACFAVQYVTRLENSFVAFEEKGNKDQVVRVF